MKYEVSFYEMDYGANIFAGPDNCYKVEYIDIPDPDKYKETMDAFVSTVKDSYGNVCEPQEFKIFGYDFQYTSHTGGVKIKEYKIPHFLTF